MIPESLRRTQRALRLSTRKHILKETLSEAEESELARLNAQAEKTARECIRSAEAQSKAMKAHHERTRDLNIGTYGAVTA